MMSLPAGSPAWQVHVSNLFVASDAVLPLELGEAFLDQPHVSHQFLDDLGEATEDRDEQLFIGLRRCGHAIPLPILHGTGPFPVGRRDHQRGWNR